MDPARATDPALLYELAATDPALYSLAEEEEACMALEEEACWALELVT